MITPNTPIPTARRSLVRAYVKSRPDFATWHMGLLKSRTVRNKELIRFCLDTGRYMDIGLLLHAPLNAIKRLHLR